jgi:hypothetical protein
LLEAVRAATADDEEIAALWHAIHDDRLRRARITTRRLESKAKLRTTQAQAVRTLWTLTIPELYVVQTHTAGRTPAQYERWLADLLVAALLEP